MEETRVVGLLVVDVQHPYFSSVVEDIRDELKKTGIKVVSIHPGEVNSEIFEDCPGYIYVGALKFFSGFVEVVKNNAKGARKAIGIFEGSGGSCKDFIRSFKNTAGVVVFSDFNPLGLARKVAEAITI